MLRSLHTNLNWKLDERNKKKYSWHPSTCWLWRGIIFDIFKFNIQDKKKNNESLRLNVNSIPQIGERFQNHLFLNSGFEGWLSTESQHPKIIKASDLFSVYVKQLPSKLAIVDILFKCLKCILIFHPYFFVFHCSKNICFYKGGQSWSGPSLSLRKK